MALNHAILLPLLQSVEVKSQIVCTVMFFYVCSVDNNVFLASCICCLSFCFLLTWGSWSLCGHMYVGEIFLQLNCKWDKKPFSPLYILSYMSTHMHMNRPPLPNPLDFLLETRLVWWMFRGWSIALLLSTKAQGNPLLSVSHRLRSHLTASYTLNSYCDEWLTCSFAKLWPIYH